MRVVWQLLLNNMLNEAVRRARAMQATCSKLPSTIEHKCNSYQKSFNGRVVLKEDDNKKVVETEP